MDNVWWVGGVGGWLWMDGSGRVGGGEQVGPETTLAATPTHPPHQYDPVVCMYILVVVGEMVWGFLVLNWFQTRTRTHARACTHALAHSANRTRIDASASAVLIDCDCALSANRMSPSIEGSCV